LRWFTSPRCLLTAYGFSGGSFGSNQRGFPHSEIPGSKPICGSPGLIAAYRVLHRLLVPRHSPYTLSSLTIRNSNLRLPGFGIRDSGFEERSSNPQSQIPNPDTRQFHAHCVCVVGKKLPFAEYSVVKEPESRIGDLVCWRTGELHSPTHQLTNLPNHQLLDRNWWRI